MSQITVRNPQNVGAAPLEWCWLQRQTAAADSSNESSKTWAQKVFAADNILKKIVRNILKLPFEHSDKIKKKFLVRKQKCFASANQVHQPLPVLEAFKILAKYKQYEC